MSLRRQTIPMYSVRYAQSTLLMTHLMLLMLWDQVSYMYIVQVHGNLMLTIFYLILHVYLLKLVYAYMY